MSKLVKKKKKERSANRRGFYFGDCAIMEIWKDLEPLAGTEFHSNAVNAVVGSMAAALLMSQMRTSWKFIFAQYIFEVKQGYKHIKNGLIFFPLSPIVSAAAVIAAIRTSAFTELSLEDLTISYINKFSRNAKVIPTRLIDNYTLFILWAAAFMSRHVVYLGA